MWIALPMPVVRSLELLGKSFGNLLEHVKWYPKMDGENNGKPYFLMDDLGVPLFLETSKWTMVLQCILIKIGERAV